MTDLITSFRLRAIAGLCALLASTPAAMPQQPAPRIGYVYPAGGRQGSTFEITVGGQALDGVNSVHISGKGVEAMVVEHTKPMTPQQFNSLRDKVKELQEKKAAATATGGKEKPQTSTKPAWTPEDEKTLADLRKKVATFVRKPANPAIAETVSLWVTLAPDAEPGTRDLRLETPAGLTNPLVFCIDQLPEFSEEESKTVSEPGRGELRSARPPEARTPQTEMTVTLPAIVNGQIMPGTVDRIRFQARKGERLVVAAVARALIPYLADAVPGWFQATLALYDSKGKELAYDDDYRFHPDPVLFYLIPADGEYVIEIKDAIYRGREDFVYRIALGQFPFITAVFPLGGKTGSQTTVKTTGWNLPVTSLTVDTKDKSPGTILLSVHRRDATSNRVPFALDTLPESLEQEPNNQPGNAETVTLPVIVNGRIGQAGDWDVFRFDGHAGGEIVAEVYARRLDSPLDSVLKLTDSAGKQLAFNDDHEDKAAGLTTHHADSWFRTRLPADGTYYIHLGDGQHKGGVEYAYRLRIGPPRPDFELRVVPSSLNVRGGAAVPLTVYALRKDGFSGEIKLGLKDAPAGFTLSGARVPADQDKVRLTLTAPPKPSKEPFRLSLEGRAVIQGREVVRPAVPAEDMMQAFAYRHLVPSEELLVAVSGRGMQRNPVRIVGITPVRIPAGGTGRVQVTVPAKTPGGTIQFELSEPPDGITIASVTPAGPGTEIVLQSDAAKAKPGLRGNLIVNAFSEKAPPSGTATTQASKRRVPIGTLPAVPFEVVAK